MTSTPEDQAKRRKRKKSLLLLASGELVRVHKKTELLVQGKRLKVLQESAHKRPKIYGDCELIGACPYVGCRHHLAIDVRSRTNNGSGNQRFALTHNWGEQDFLDAEYTCSLKAAKYPKTPLRLARILGITLVRTRQILVRAMLKFRTRYKRMFGQFDPSEGNIFDYRIKIKAVRLCRQFSLISDQKRRLAA